MFLWSVSITAQDGCPFPPAIVTPVSMPLCHTSLAIKHASCIQQHDIYFLFAFLTEIAPECQRGHIHGMKCRCVSWTYDKQGFKFPDSSRKNHGAVMRHPSDHVCLCR